MSREPHDDDTRLIPAPALGAENPFPIVLRGYDRQAVDAHIADLHHQLDELASVRSPEAAVQRALDRVGAETAGILREAHRTAEELTTSSRAQAEELTASSRAQADDRLQRAEREAVERRAEAEARVAQLDRDADVIWQERQRLIEDTRKLADTLLHVADDAAERFPAEELPVDETVPVPPGGDLDPPAAEPESVDAELARAEEHPQATVSMDRAELERAMAEPDAAEATTERRGEAA